MFKKILVPVDGSPFSEAAIPVALSVSRRCGASVELVSVEAPAPSLASEAWEVPAADWAAGYLDDLIDRIGESAGSGGVTSTVLSGRVSDSLARHATETEADLVAMATHGRGAVTRAWLGSVADSFVRHTTKPVLLVRPEPHTEPDLGADVPLQRILIPTDGSAFSHAVAEPALTLGGLFDARYTVVRVVIFPVDVATPYLPHTVQMNQPVVETATRVAGEETDRPVDVATPYLPHTVQMNQEMVETATRVAEEETDRLARELKERALIVDTEIHVSGRAAHKILMLAEELDCQLVALATHGRGGVARALLGSVADKVIRGSHRNVLVLQPPMRD